MNQKKLLKIFTIILVALLVSALSTMVLGYSEYLDPDQIRPQDSNAVGTIRDISGIILTVIQVVGVAVAVIMLVWLGIKYIAASPNEKADIKKGAVIYIVGAILLFGASGLIQIFKNLGEGISEVV